MKITQFKEAALEEKLYSGPAFISMNFMLSVLLFVWFLYFLISDFLCNFNDKTSMNMRITGMRLRYIIVIVSCEPISGYQFGPKSLFLPPELNKESIIVPG